MVNEVTPLEAFMLDSSMTIFYLTIIAGFFLKGKNEKYSKY